MGALKIKKIAFIILIVFIACFYLYFANWQNEDITAASAPSYYNYLLDAFVHARLDVNTPPKVKVKFDLSLYNNRYYLYWGPPPVLFALPFYLVKGIGASDTIYNLVAGLLNVILFSFICTEALKHFKVRYGERLAAIAVISFALVSPNFFLSTVLGVWATNQIVSILYLLVFIYFYFKFLNRLKKFYFLGISAIFSNLAWFSRNSLVFDLLLFAYPLYLFFQAKDWISFKKTIFAVSAITCMTFLMYFGYNYLRFGDIFETGLKYQLSSGEYTQALRTSKSLSLGHIQGNLKSYFFNFPSLKLNPPQLIFHKEFGTSVFITYPLLLMFILLPFTKIAGNQRVFLALSLAVVILNIFVLALYFPLGGLKGGNRYLFDVIPLLTLMIVLIFPKTSFLFQYLLLFFGIIISSAIMIGYF